jgi:hypothetical protein
LENKEKKALKVGRRITSQVTANIIDDFQNRYLSEAQYINYKVISQSRSGDSFSFLCFQALKTTGAHIYVLSEENNET